MKVGAERTKRRRERDGKDRKVRQLIGEFRRFFVD